MKEENYKDLLTFSGLKDNPKNTIKATIEMDSNDGDYITNIIEIEPEKLFGNKKLIYCLAYVGYDNDYFEDDPVFGNHIEDNKDIIDLERTLRWNDFVCSTDWGICHSYTSLEIIYYDENGVGHNVGFDKIYERWDKMGYEEICEEINSIPEDESNS